MSTYRQSIPQADTLMGSMRSMGYSFEAAIADIIDNSISANCSVVKLFFPSEPTEDLVVGILDDGEGMSADVLFEAMRYGSTDSELERNANDLGRFGLGMKSASLSQCRILTVVSLQEEKISSYSWDYNYIQNRKEWVVKELSKNEIKALPYIHSLLELPHGTLVLWQDFDVLEKSSGGMVYDALVELKESVANNIALIFHNFLSAKGKEQIKMYLNKGRIKPMDPFLESHSKTTTKKARSIAIRDSKGQERQIWVKPYILPFATDLNDEHRKLIGGVETLSIKQGFYVYAKPNQCDPKNVVKYIGRYLGRPVIATSRIDKYDGELVTFHYNRHEDEKYVVETIPAMDFIKRLIRHIPEKHFKMIRYGGLYARHRSIDSKLHRTIHKSKHHFYRSFNQWRTAILSSFGYDPFLCSECSHQMEFLELYYNHQRVSLEELYEKAMSKSRGKRSSA